MSLRRCVMRVQVDLLSQGDFSKLSLGEVALMGLVVRFLALRIQRNPQRYDATPEPPKPQPASPAHQIAANIQKTSVAVEREPVERRVEAQHHARCLSV